VTVRPSPQMIFENFVAAIGQPSFATVPRLR
jgi:hypothetical protein